MGLLQAARWKAALDKEFASLEKYDVFEWVPITAIAKLVGTSWVFNIKVDSTYKGRMVIQGFPRILGVDCGDTFAPECRLQSIRMMLALAAELDYEVHMLDVKTAFRRRGGRVGQDGARL